VRREIVSAAVMNSDDGSYEQNLHHILTMQQI